MKESINNFHSRIYVNYNFQDTRVLVWKSAKEKKKFGVKASEIWDLETSRNYERHLNEQIHH